MKEDILVELHLEKSMHRFFAQASDTGDATTQGNVAKESMAFDHTKTKFIADYLIYPQDQMDNYARQVETRPSWKCN